MRAFALSLVLIALPGCAAFRPMDGVPARYLPEELKGHSRADQQMIDLSLLRRPQNNDYRVDAGDVLAVYIENILGRADVPPINQPQDPNRPPTLGYPLTVRDDGTLAVPRFGPIFVRGKSIPDVEATIRIAFTYQRRFMQPGQNDRVVVSLHQPRQHRVLVVRQESQSDALSSVNISSGQLGGTKKGTGKIVSLPAYKNDVMHALVESGGLPGLDAQAVVWVIRSKKEPQPFQKRAATNRSGRFQSTSAPTHSEFTVRPQPQHAVRAESKHAAQHAVRPESEFAVRSELSRAEPKSSNHHGADAAVPGSFQRRTQLADAVPQWTADDGSTGRQWIEPTTKLDSGADESSWLAKQRNAARRSGPIGSAPRFFERNSAGRVLVASNASTNC